MPEKSESYNWWEESVTEMVARYGRWCEVVKGVDERCVFIFFFFFSSRRRHTRCSRDWSSDVCSSDLLDRIEVPRDGFVGVCSPRNPLPSRPSHLFARHGSLLGHRAATNASSRPLR